MFGSRVRPTPSHRAEQWVREAPASPGPREHPEDMARLIQDLFAARRVRPDPAEIEAVVRRTGEEIHRRYGENGFGLDRLNRTERDEAGIGELSVRQYDKRLGLLRRLEAKPARLAVHPACRSVATGARGASQRSASSRALRASQRSWT